LLIKYWFNGVSFAFFFKTFIDNINQKIKNMKKKMLCLLAFGLLITTSVKAQNNVWAIPNNDGSQGYWKVGDFQVSAFPSTDPDNNNQAYTDPTVGYNPDLNNGTHLHRGASNAITNPDGDLLFFIVGNAIFDAYGRTIWMQDNYGVGVTSGFSEIAVAPYPGDCNKYYIFTDYSVLNPNENVSLHASPYSQF